MPKRQRSAEEKMEYYRSKLLKYEQRHNKNVQDVGHQPEECSVTGYTSYWSDSEAEDMVLEDSVDPNQGVDMDSEDPEGDQPVLAEILPASEVLPLPTLLEQTAQPEKVSEPEVPLQVPPVEETPVPTLDPEILEALGEATDGSPEFGEKIHNNLAQLWTPLLKKGLLKEKKDSLLKEYLVPENCKLLQAPKLNAEITAAISELARNRDKKMTSTQQQLGIGITAINKAMTVLLESNDKVKAIKYLSDGCRLLCDLHYLETSYRTKLITPNLDKSFCHVIQDNERDDTLFGNKLSDKIKASKAIERQGLQIKKSHNTTKPSTSQAQTGRPAPSQGNWAGHSRSSNRGGRGGGRRHHAPTTTNPSSRAAPASTQHQQPQNANKSRAAAAPRR